MECPETIIRRRDLLRFAIVSAGAAAANTAAPELTAATPIDLQDKRKTRYQANSPEVKNFYRVNKYPPRIGRRPC